MRGFLGTSPETEDLRMGHPPRSAWLQTPVQRKARRPIRVVTESFVRTGDARGPENPMFGLAGKAARTRPRADPWETQSDPLFPESPSSIPTQFPCDGTTGTRDGNPTTSTSKARRVISEIAGPCNTPRPNRRRTRGSLISVVAGPRNHGRRGASGRRSR